MLYICFSIATLGEECSWWWQWYENEYKRELVRERERKRNRKRKNKQENDLYTCSINRLHKMKHLFYDVIVFCFPFLFCFSYWILLGVIMLYIKFASAEYEKKIIRPRNEWVLPQSFRCINNAAEWVVMSSYSGNQKTLYQSQFKIYKKKKKTAVTTVLRSQHIFKSNEYLHMVPLWKLILYLEAFNIKFAELVGFVLIWILLDLNENWMGGSGTRLTIWSLNSMRFRLLLLFKGSAYAHDEI